MRCRAGDGTLTHTHTGDETSEILQALVQSQATVPTAADMHRPGWMGPNTLRADEAQLTRCMLFLLAFPAHVHCSTFSAEKVVPGPLKHCSAWGRNMSQAPASRGYASLPPLSPATSCASRTMGASLYVRPTSYILCVSECMCENKKESEV